MFDSLAQSIDQASAVQFWGVLIAVALLLLWFFYRGFKHLRLSRLIEDTPTSLIRSAHQGFVEFEGRVNALPGEPVHAPLSGRVCVWYDYSIDHLESRWRGGRRQSVWVSLEQGRSDAIFALEDGTGRCVIDPDGADMQPTHVISWQGYEKYPYNTPPGHSDFTGPYRYRERLIEPGDPIYALGWFETQADPAQKGLMERTRELLRRWKQAPEKLLHRFDLNRDGRIDQREWEIVRRQAEKEALREQGKEKPGEVLHLLRKPADGNLPFILSANDQAGLISDFRRRALGYLCLFVLGFAAIAWAFQERIN